MSSKKNSEDKSVSLQCKILLGLITALILINSVTALLYFKEKKSVKKENISEYPLLDPARKFVKQDDLIVNFQPLRDYLDNKYKSDQDFSFYFEYLPTGANIAMNKDAEFYPASLLKVPVAIAVAQKIENGEWRWDNELVLMSADKDDRFGTLYKEPTNSIHTIEDLVKRSLTDSDNTAHFMLVRNLEIEEMKKVYDHMGMEGFLDTEGSLSAKRYSLIFRMLYASSYLSEENSEKLLSFLSLSNFDDYIQSGLPKDVIFSHKIGVDIEKKVYLDSGIVYAKGRAYIITIMTKGKSEQVSREIMKNVSEIVYNYVNNYRQ